MIKPEHLPDVVIDAAVAMRDRGGSMSDIIRTAINAWPGVSKIVVGINKGSIILPLNTEKTDD